MTVFSVEHIEHIDLTSPNDASTLKELTGGTKVTNKGSIPPTPKEVVPHLFCKRCHGNHKGCLKTDRTTPLCPTVLIKDESNMVLAQQGASLGSLIL